MGKNLKFNICGGKKNDHLPKEYLNVDLEKTADIVTDIRKKLPIEDKCAIEIISCATLEHLTLREGYSLLKEFSRILQPGGKLVIAVPSFDKIMKGYLERKVSFRTLNMFLYGGQFNEYDYHKCVYTFERLKELLTKFGFANIEEKEYDMKIKHNKELMMQLTCIKKGLTI